jgi:hypothetical protein
VLSIRYLKGDGSGVVQAKASGCPGVDVRYSVMGMTSGTLTKVDWQGRSPPSP